MGPAFGDGTVRPGGWLVGWRSSHGGGKMGKMGKMGRVVLGMMDGDDGW